MSVKISPYGLAKHGRVLATRELGRSVGRSVQDHAPDHGALVLDFHDVEVASPPFLDEVVRAIRATIDAPHGGRHVVLVDYNPDVRECLEIVLQRHKLAMVGMKKKQRELLGGSEQLQRTVEEARKLGEFTPPELAERLEIKLPALHQRLKALLDSGVLVREEDPTAERGVRHTYSVVPA